MPQNIRDVMTSNPCTIDAEKSVAYAAKMMLEEDVGLAPIVEGDRLIGMLTDRDIATRVAAEGRDPDQVKVRDVASTQLFSIDPTQDLDEALRMMAKHQVRRLPVVEADGRLVGVVAQADIAREASDTQTGQLVEEISESGGQMSSIEEGQFPTQFPRPIDDQPESSLIGEEPQVEAQQEEEGVSKVQAASSRGRRKRSTTKRKTAARKSTGTRKRKTASRKRSTAKRSTAKRSTTKKRSTAKRKTAGRKAASTRKRKTATRKTAGRKAASTRKRKTSGRKKAAATRKRKTATRKTAGRKAAGTRKRKTGGRKSATRKTAGRKAASTRKRKTATRKTAGRKAASTRKRKTTTRKRSTAKRSTAKRRSTTRRRTSR